MKQKLISILVFALLVSINSIFGQGFKVGKVSKKELQEKFYPLDSSANAVILYKSRGTFYVYKDQVGWTLVTRVKQRIKIYNRNGYDWATHNIRLYKNGRKKEKVSVTGYTYNLVKNKVKKTKLEANAIFNENINEHWSESKFTMPNLKEGSIVEWSYVLRSPFIQNIDDMIFQHKIPVKYMISRIGTPEFFIFKNQSKGFIKADIRRKTGLSKIYLTSKNRPAPTSRTNYSSTTSYDQNKIEYVSYISECIQKDVPALIEEPFTNNIKNYIPSLTFELETYRPKGGAPQYYTTSWKEVTKTIFESTNFGAQLKKKSHFKDDLERIIKKSNSQNKKVQDIYEFVKRKMKWNNFIGKYTDKGVKKAYENGVGNAAEINLTLVAMLREAGIKSNPVLVSTRDNGIPLSPTTQGFNYVIAGVEFDNNTLLLDATEKYAPPNILPLRALNWHGRIIRKDGSSNQINLSPTNHSSIKVFINVDLKHDATIKGTSRMLYSELMALNYRNDYNNINVEDLIRILERENENIEISALNVSNEEDISKALTHAFKFESDNQVEVIGDKMYFSPLLFLKDKKNPFKLENRTYPVDFGAPFEKKYTISINIPKGYKIESKPDNIVIDLPEEMGLFQFATILKGNQLQVLASTKINLPVISPMYYASLKEFYKKLVDKQLEKVVLSKL